jgi:hypothetical protein
MTPSDENDQGERAHCAYGYVQPYNPLFSALLFWLFLTLAGAAGLCLRAVMHRLEPRSIQSDY